jgi:hypothetical protein
LHGLTSLAAATHHAFELAAGVGLVFQPYLGLGGAGALWATTLPVWTVASARGSRRWDPGLAFLAGLSLGGAALHYALWPWAVRRCLPTLTEAEGLRPEHLPAYNAIILTWGGAAAGALLFDTPRRARPWALPGIVMAMALRGSARRHFEWIREQAALRPAWWNRALRR